MNKGSLQMGDQQFEGFVVCNLKDCKILVNVFHKRYTLPPRV